MEGANRKNVHLLLPKKGPLVGPDGRPLSKPEDVPTGQQIQIRCGFVERTKSLRLSFNVPTTVVDLPIGQSEHLIGGMVRALDQLKALLKKKEEEANAQPTDRPAGAAVAADNGRSDGGDQAKGPEDEQA